MEAELPGIRRALRVQTLRLEEQEHPEHPIVALASERIVELSTREAAVTITFDKANQFLNLGATIMPNYCSPTCTKVTAPRSCRGCLK